MRVEGESDGKLREQGPANSGPRDPLPGVFRPRVCICPTCGSKNTATLGTTHGDFLRMECRRCGNRFRAVRG